jgi:hypothetical protein
MQVRVIANPCAFVRILTTEAVDMSIDIDRRADD